MRILILVWSLICGAALPALADQRDPRLEQLFNQLASVRTAPEAQTIVAQIESIWRQSGSDTVDLLVARGASASEAQDLDTAMKIFDVVAEMRPRYAEIWFRRAELLVAMDSQQEAASDLAKAVALEPRHFQAHALLGRLADLSGNKALALAAFRKAVALNPTLENVAKRAGELAFEVERKPL